MRRVRFTIVSVLGVLLALASGARADAKIEEQLVGPPIASGNTYFVSPRGARLASLTNKGSRVVVVVDGVEGPVFDQMLAADGKPYFGPNAGIDTRGQLGAVLFSQDGARYAYCARLGNEVVVILDGKEFARYPNNASTFGFGALSFSPGGKHLCYVVWDQTATKRTLYMDGKPLAYTPEKAESGAPEVYFSRDDQRFLYYAADPQKQNSKLLIVDGKEAGYFGIDARFSNDGKQVLSVGSPSGPATLLADGKPALPGMTVERFHLAPSGNRVIAVANRPNLGGSLHFIVVDGKKIDASECLYGVDRVVFSPDGKRYAARCRGQASAWIIIDGTKSQEYGGIGDELTFSPDSSKFAFVASNANKNFVVQDGTESNPYDQVFTKPVFSPDGKHMGFVAGVNRLNLDTVFDGKVVSKMNDSGTFIFSQDGSRFAALAVGMGQGQHNIDGVDQKEIAGSDILFTPNGKHVRVIGQRLKDRVNGIFVDGQRLFTQTGRFNRRPVFSPDGNHIYWTSVELDQTIQPPRLSVIYVDNKPVGKFNADLNQYMEAVPETWEIDKDGVLTTLVATPDGIKRLKITPDPAVTVDGMLAEVKAAEAKALADAEAVKKQAEEEAARKKAEADAARAKAAADTQKAREDAAAARAKAAADRAAAAAAARAARQNRSGGNP